MFYFVSFPWNNNNNNLNIKTNRKICSSETLILLFIMYNLHTNAQIMREREIKNMCLIRLSFFFSCLLSRNNKSRNNYSSHSLFFFRLDREKKINLWLYMQSSESSPLSLCTLSIEKIKCHKNTHETETWRLQYVNISRAV